MEGERIMKRRVAKKVMKKKEIVKYSEQQIKHAKKRIDKSTTKEDAESKEN